MRIRHRLMVLVLVIGAAVLIVPALAVAQSEPQSSPKQGMGIGHMGRGMMSGGCAGMMQSMSGNRAPNSQWHPHGQSDQATPN